MGVFNRLGYNFDSTKFGSGEPFTEGQAKLLDSASSLKTWQADDLINVAATGYFQNPHTANLTTLSTLATNIMVYANTANANIVFSDTTTSNVANLLFAAANTLYNEIPNFTEHTNRMSGVTSTTNGNVLPDYQIAMAVGRQVLAITNQIDGMQNNSPLLGNFTSLAIGPDIANNITKLNNDLNGLFSNSSSVNNFWFKNINAGAYHSAAINSDNTLWVWGAGVNGGLGLGDTSSRFRPVKLGLLSNWSQVSCGYNDTLAIQSNGTLWAWGRNNNGQLGIGNGAGSRSSPTQVGSVSTWSQVSCGYKHTLGYRSDGTLWAWGDGALGELGIGVAGFYSTPAQIGFTAGEWTSKFSAGNRFSMAIQPNGTLWSWGWNAYGQLGLSNTTNRSSPTQVGSLSVWTQVACGYYYTLALQSNGTLWAWGWNLYGAVGTGISLNYSPVQIGDLSAKWTQISTKKYSSLAIQSNGTLWAWGANDSGQLGLSDTTDRSSPVQVGALSNWTKINSSNHTLALQSDGILKSWGWNSDGQLGTSDTTTRSSPIQVTNYTSINTTSSDSMNTFILDVQSAYNLLSQRRQGDTNFYLNSLALVNDYNKVSQFSTVGVNSNYLINTLNIGTDKLKNNLQSNTVIPTVVNSGTYSTSATADSYTTSTSGLSVTGVSAGNYSNANLTIDAYGRILYAANGSSGGGGSSSIPSYANSANALTTSNFSISESGGKLIFKYGSTVIASMGANGIFISANNVIAAGTP
jgi:alpha-tubulin suppressor-like RCC1 family protein